MSMADIRARAAPLRMQRWLLVGIASGGLFLAIFAACSPLHKDAYAYRDDAVITLSHARNFVDYGSIGVDASGARVEGFSTPLQFWVFVIAYAATHCGFERFLDWQVAICSFLLGFGVVQLFGARWRMGLLLSAAVALALTQAVRFFGWHHSGMENAYTHALFVGTLACIVYSIESGRVQGWMVACAWLASLARLESMLHVFPLLLIWAAAYYSQHRSLRALRAGLMVLGGFAAYQLWRYAYFGDLHPNTAVAEHIDVTGRLRALWVDPAESRNAVLTLLKQILGEHRAYLALLSIPLLTLGPRSTANSVLTWMLASLFVTALVHPLLFGAARLDPVRTTSHLALVPPLLVLTQWARIARPALRVVSFLCIGLCTLVYSRLETPSDHWFCCPIRRADAITDSCLAHAAREALPAPSLASPDLGKESFRKRLLMFDLGLLGSPPLAALRGEHTAFANYVFELAAPDFIELHGAWACQYRFLQNDERYDARYALVPESAALKLEAGCRGSRAGVWFRQAVSRASRSPERQLIDALAKAPDLRRIAQELGRCRQLPGSLACVYVTRSVYRFIPKFVRAGNLDQVVALFRVSPSAAYDTSVLRARSHGLWYRDVVSFARSL
jgi:hypothetical protein